MGQIEQLVKSKLLGNDNPNNLVWPITKTQAVYDKTNTDLQTVLDSLGSEIQEIKEINNVSVRYDQVQELTEEQKETARNNIDAGTYSKPEDGIPASDLDSEIQTSLEKADSSLQSIKTFASQNLSGSGDAVRKHTMEIVSESQPRCVLFYGQTKSYTALVSVPSANFSVLVCASGSTGVAYDYSDCVDAWGPAEDGHFMMLRFKIGSNLSIGDHDVFVTFLSGNFGDDTVNIATGGIPRLTTALTVVNYYQKPSTGIPASDIANDAIKSFAGVPIKGSGDVMVRISPYNSDGGFIIKNALYTTCKLLIVPEHHNGFAYFNGGANTSMLVVNNTPSQCFIIDAESVRDIYFGISGGISYNILLLEGTMPQIETPSERPEIGAALNAQVIRDTSNFITKSVNNLTNYYLKSETYTKAEVATQIANALTGAFVSTNSLPSASANTMGKIYLVPSSAPQTANVKDEYITITGGLADSPTYSWEKIGNTAVSLDGVVKFDESQSLTDAQKTQARANIGAGTYSKPSNGIPASDLASGVIPETIESAEVSVDANVGTPSASASVSGGVLSFEFHNLKGETGATGATGATGPQGPQGPQGNTGSSVDYPYELVNNLTTDDATKGLSAAQGVVLDGKISQLGQERAFFPISSASSATNKISPSESANSIHICFLSLENVTSGRSILRNVGNTFLLLCDASGQIYVKIGSTYKYTTVKPKKGQVYDIRISWGDSKCSFSINGVSYANEDAQSGTVDRTIGIASATNFPVILAQFYTAWINRENFDYTTGFTWGVDKISDFSLKEGVLNKIVYPVSSADSSSGKIALSDTANDIHLSFLCLEDVSSARSLLRVVGNSFFLLCDASGQLYVKIGSTYKYTTIKPRKGHLYDIKVSWGNSACSFSVNGTIVANGDSQSDSASGNVGIYASSIDSVILAQFYFAQINGETLDFSSFVWDTNRIFDYDPNVRIDNLDNREGINPALGTFEFGRMCHHLNVEKASDIIIPSQSLYDIEYAKLLGFKFIEANLHTCSDGVVVVKHGVGTTLGNGLLFSQGSSLTSSSQWSAVTSTDLRNDVTYDSILPKYRGHIPTLTEFCKECARLGMAVYLRGCNTASLNEARKYLPDSHIIAEGISSRGDFKGIIGYWGSDTDTTTILERAKGMGSPYWYGLLSINNISDETLTDIAQALHQNGFLFGCCYLSANNYIKMCSMGMDIYSSTDHLVVPFELGNVLNITKGNDAGLTLVDSSYNATDDVIEMESSGTITISSQELGTCLGKITLYIRFAGNIDVKLGTSVSSADNISGLTSSGAEGVTIAYAIEKVGSQLVQIKANAATTIQDIRIFASKI